MKENYLCSVIILKEREISNSTVKNSFSVIIRNVNAYSAEEAIGKFLTNTQYINRVETLLPVDCFPIKNLTVIE
jgi:hypothetical protein